MNPIERVMRVMTHVNIGTALGMVAWILWSGYQVASGAWQVPQVRPAPPTSPTAAGTPTASLGCCFAPMTRPVLTAAGAAAAPRQVAALERSQP